MFTKVSNNQKTVYKYRNWQEFGYIDYITYADYLQKLYQNGEIDEETRRDAVLYRRNPRQGQRATEVKEYIDSLRNTARATAIPFQRLNAIMQTPEQGRPGGQPSFRL